MRFFMFCFLFFWTNFLYGKNLILYGMGDSITAGSNVDGFGTFLQFNWVTGNSLNDSHFQKLLKRGLNPVANNIAVPGAVLSDLTSQLSKIDDEQVDYFGISIGANDICYWPSKNYEENMEKYLKDLDDFLVLVSNRFPTAKIKFLPVPDVAHVKQLAGNSGYCRLVWNTSGLCKNILQEKNQQILREYSDLVAILNRRIQETLESRNSTLYDMPHPEIANKFELKHLSTADCFHPSVEGQRFISDNLWLETETDL